MHAVFTSVAPSPADYWRSIILFGRNVASYKFALATALLELKPKAGQLIKLDELALPFASNIADHIRNARQGQFTSSEFLKACKSFSEGALDKNGLIDKAVRLGFVNVIDAFHVVGQNAVPTPFFFDERKVNGGIRITDQFSELAESNQAFNLPNEVDARWKLVETAWDLGVSRNLLSIQHDSDSQSIFAIDKSLRRRTVTSSRNALNGYQKGFCFYCFRPIRIDQEELMPDVDHFFPHALKKTELGELVDGIWNLVLACRQCNRGTDGKFDRVPASNLLERLYRRNEFLISSHHPLRETLISQTGLDAMQRRSYLADFDQKAFSNMPFRWEAKEHDSPKF